MSDVMVLPIDVDSHWGRWEATPAGGGARLFLEAMRAARAVGGGEVPGKHGCEGDGLVRWKRPALKEVRLLARGQAALARWREAARLGGPVMVARDALERGEERQRNLDAARWLFRVAAWKSARLRGARRLDWSLELLLDMLRSARDLAAAAPLDQAVLASEAEILLWRELREWASSKHVTTELLERAREQVARPCGQRVDRRAVFSNELVLQVKLGKPLSPATTAAFAGLLAVAEQPPGQRPPILAVEPSSGDVHLGCGEEDASRLGLAPARSVQHEPDDRAALRRLFRATEIFDQRDTAAAATLAFFVTVAYHSRLGMYPTELASSFQEIELAPPADPYCPAGEPLRMRRANSETFSGAGVDTSRGWLRARAGQPLIYSVGPNGKDEDAVRIWNGAPLGDGDWMFPLPPHRTPRHWRQFDLRKALALMTFCCLVLALLLSAPQRQVRAVRTIENLGGYLEYASSEDIDTQSFMIRWFGVERFGTVTSVNIDGEVVNDKVLAHISQFPELSSLQINGATVGAEGLRAIGRMKNLESIEMSNATFTEPEAFEHWGQLTKLAYLDVEESTFDDVALGSLPALPRLESLDMNNTEVSGAGFRNIAQRMPRLSSLITYTSPVKDEALPEIGKLRSLDRLDLDGAKITDDAVRHLAGLGKVTMLDIQRTGLTDEALQHLKGLKALKELRLNATKIKGPGLAHLARLPALDELSLEETPLTEAAVDHLVKLKHLSTINVDGSALTKTQLRTLRQRGLKNLDVTGEVDMEEVLDILQDLAPVLDELKKQHAETTPEGAPKGRLEEALDGVPELKKLMRLRKEKDPPMVTPFGEPF